MLYNDTKTSCGTVMPLLMGCTKPQLIETTADTPQIYDPITQSVVYDMRTVGTYSLKTSYTTYKNSSGNMSSNKTDRKNAIDDSKNVK